MPRSVSGGEKLQDPANYLIEGRDAGLLSTEPPLSFNILAVVIIVVVVLSGFEHLVMRVSQAIHAALWRCRELSSSVRTGFPHGGLEVFVHFRIFSGFNNPGSGVFDPQTRI